MLFVKKTLILSLFLIPPLHSLEVALAGDSGTLPTSSESADNVAVPAEGDRLFGFIFDRVDDQSVILSGAKWDKTIIPVCWENPSDVYKSDMEDVRKNIEESWSKNSCLKFTGWAKCQHNNKGIRIKISDEGPHVKNLGKMIDGWKDGMVLNFTYKNWGADSACNSTENERKLCNKSIAVHEFGHALAFAHEQNRWDTPGECAAAPQGGDGDVYLTSWDRDSVMNYCNPVYSNNGVLSAADKVGLKKSYCLAE